jgi:hypothetical protein
MNKKIEKYLEGSSQGQSMHYTSIFSEELMQNDQKSQAG